MGSHVQLNFVLSFNRSYSSIVLQVPDRGRHWRVHRFLLPRWGDLHSWAFGRIWGTAFGEHYFAEGDCDIFYYAFEKIKISCQGKYVLQIYTNISANMWTNRNMLEKQSWSKKMWSTFCFLVFAFFNDMLQLLAKEKEHHLKWNITCEIDFVECVSYHWLVFKWLNCQLSSIFNLLHQTLTFT